MEINPLTRSAVRFAAALHASSLPHGFFPQLGVGFLRSYYRSFIASPHAIALAAEVDGQPVGVLVGTVDTGLHWRWVVRHRGLRFAATGAVALLCHPRAASTFLRHRATRYLRAALRLGWQRTEPAGERRPLAIAVLAHLAVDPAARRRGVGAALVRAFCQGVAEAGASRAELVTAAGSDGSAAFYGNLGWSHDEDRLDRDGRLMSVMSLSLRPAERPSERLRTEFD